MEQNLNSYIKICRHFGKCGGCSLQNISYPEQLKQKETNLKEFISKYEIKAELKPMNFYSPYYFYRNKMEFTFGSDKEELILGLYKKNSNYEILNIEECLIFSPIVGKILEAIRRFVKKYNYPVYNKFSRQGFLRNIVLRETKYTNELMLGIVTTSIIKLDKDALVNSLLDLKINSLKSIYWIVNNSYSDAVIFESKDLIYGEPFIKEKLEEFIFYIGIDSFFQVNPVGVKDFYIKLRKYANLKEDDKVLDLFCGIGSIGIFLAPFAKFVWGIDIKESSIELAYKNAKINNIKNISFFSSDVRKFLNQQITFFKDIEVLIVNPPRAGLSKKVISYILKLAPKVIFYSSCNPLTFFRDLTSLSLKYNIDFIEPFDFFPHTPHIECLGMLKIKN